MLTRTFIHVPGIGERRERNLWRRGFTDWKRFLRDHPSGPWRDLVASRLDLRRAARDIPRREAWRLLPGFPGKTAYLDIETEGLAVGRDGITCIGISDGESVEFFIQGKNLGRFPSAIRKYDLLVTYNGSCFDLPILQRAFPEVDFRRFHHLDLRYPLHRLGIKGGLKGAEKQVGLSRDAAVEGVDGYMAVLLWRAHRKGHPRALETLVRYCLEDVVNLKPLAAHAYNVLAAQLPIEVEAATDVSIPRIPHEADRSLVLELLERIGRRG